ncbi:MAG: hypothetical protein KAT34_05350 [Candidatus Aminicenantes bacterium]|nr:hypothetical protein [Candidatus Aminicenantes bacterium]
MPVKIKPPTIIKADGNKPKVIEEFIGRVNSNTEAVSVARMKSPPGWVSEGATAYVPIRTPINLFSILEITQNF